MYYICIDECVLYGIESCASLYMYTCNCIEVYLNE